MSEKLREQFMKESGIQPVGGIDIFRCNYITWLEKRCEQPIYETPEQYKERTGKDYPDDEGIFYRALQPLNNEWGNWKAGRYGQFRHNKNGENIQMIVFNFPDPNWMPE